MQPFLPTFVLRHSKENLKKCSLRGLEQRKDFVFATYPIKELPPLDHYIVLELGAPPLTVADRDAGLFVIDATWRYAMQMAKRVEPWTQSLVKRSIPNHYRTAYPRRQSDCPDPDCGLASVEAIYIAYFLLGRDVSGLLDGYYWKEVFLEKNGF